MADDRIQPVTLKTPNFDSAMDDTNDAVRVNIVAGSSSGTEYADGAVRGTATGTLAMGDDGTNIQSVKVDASGELQVDIAGALPAGTNNIGDVDIASIAAGDNNIGNVDVVTLPAIPAGTNAIGKLLPPDVDVTEYINTFDEVPRLEGVKAYHNPELFDPITSLKYALVDARDNFRMIDALDKLVLRPGQAIVIRAIPGDPYKDMTITINFEATKNAV